MIVGHSTHNRKLFALLLAVLTVLMLFPGIGALAADDGRILDPESTQELQNARIGVEVGSILDQRAQDLFPDSTIVYYNSISDLAKALDSGKIDAYLIDEPVFRLCQKEYPNQYILDWISQEQNGYIFPKNNEKSELLVSQINEFLADFKAQGGPEELNEIWFGEDESKKVIHFENLTGENGTLTLATNNQYPPFVYLKDNEFAGYDIDMTVRFCEKYGYNIKITNYDFSGLLAAVSVGKADFGVNAITITPERQQSMTFSDPYYTSGTVVIACHSDAAAGEESEKTEFDVTAYDGKIFGVLTGTNHDQLLEKILPNSKLVYYSTTTDLATALDAGKIEAYTCEKSCARILLRQYTEQTVAGRISEVSCAFGFPKGTEQSEILRGQMNEFLAEIETNGVKKEIEDLWFGEDNPQMIIDYEKLPDINGKLRMATSSTLGIPFTYISNGKNVGYDIDIATRFCEKYGYAMEIEDSDFGGVIANLQSGKCDFAGSCLSITEERKKSIDFADPSYYAAVVIVEKKDSSASSVEERSFFSGIAESFDKTFIQEDRWKLFASGLGTTVLITVLSAVFGSALAFGVYLLYRKKHKPFNIFIDILSDILEKTPVVVTLMILYYVLFAKSNLDGIWVSVIGFTLLFMVSVLGLIKMGVGAVDEGQMEAALAIGYTDSHAFLRIILPQAARHFMPGLRGELVSLIKGTAVVGYIAVQDLTKIGDIVRSRTYEAFFPLIAGAVIYFAAAWLLTLLVKRIEIRIDPERRNKAKILKGVQTK